MTKTEASRRVHALRRELERHNHAYYVLDAPEISDAQWDALFGELKALEAQYPDLVTPDSPTQRVGGVALEKFAKVPHAEPMLSLVDAFSLDDVRAWEERNMKVEPATRKAGYYCELKIDGLAIALVYEKGMFVQGSTRGDGRVGEDVTQNLRTVRSVPLRVRDADEAARELEKQGRAHLVPGMRRALAGRLEVRGEVYLGTKAFAALNNERARAGEEPYANPRNVAAGSVRQLDPAVTASRRLDSFTYAVVTDLGQRTHEEEHALLAALGFRTSSHAQAADDLAAVERYHERVGKMREKLDFEIDGIVVMVNDETAFRRLGAVGKTPRGGIAYKFASREAVTVVEDIQVQVGRTGALTPVAHLRPVAVGGVTVSRATLHNEEEIERLDVRVGDTVVIGRAGDVIPDVKSVLQNLRPKSAKPFRMPSHCPVCDTPTVRPQDEVIRRCPNERCPARERERLYHFASRGAMDIVGLGPKIVDQLVEANLVATPADFFTLEEGDLAGLPRFADTSAKKLIRSIAARKRVPLWRLLFALGIRHVGEETARDLATTFGSLAHLAHASRDDLLKVANVGEVMADSIAAWFADAGNGKLLSELAAAGVKPEAASPKAKGPLAGKIFVLTGTLSVLGRDEAKERIRARGGEASETVSKETTYLVAGEKPGSKLAKAQKLGVAVLEEKAFLKLLE